MSALKRTNESKVAIELSDDREESSSHEFHSCNIQVTSKRMSSARDKSRRGGAERSSLAYY